MKSKYWILKTSYKEGNVERFTENYTKTKEEQPVEEYPVSVCKWGCNGGMHGDYGERQHKYHRLTRENMRDESLSISIKKKIFSKNTHQIIN